ncbi:MAG: hypothetical protein NTZ95_04550, partial [Candidatus Omnitrophica bacterium]|nr:hypothetical protein [Candidatus Omnitrophota bacterium]
MTELEILSRIKILAEDIRKPAENLLRIIEKIHSELNTTAPVATEEIKLHDALIKAVGMPVEEKYPSKRHTGMLGAVSLIFPAHEGPGWRNGIIEEFKLLGRNAKNLQLDEIKRAVQVPIRGDEYGLTEKAENCGTVAVLLPEDKGVPQVRMMHVPFAIGLNSLSMNEKLLFDSISDLLEPEKAFERPPVFFLDIREDILMARDGSGKNLLDKAADLLNKHGIAVVALTRSRYSRSALLTDKNGVALFTETFDPADSYIEFDPIRSWLFTTKDGNPKKTATSISWDRLQKEVAAKGLFIKWDDPAQSGGNITDAGMVRPQFPVIGEGKDLYEHYVTLSSKDYDIFKIHFNGRKLSELSGEEIAEVASSVKSRFNTPFRIELVLLQHIAYRLGLYGKDKEVTAQIETLVYGFNWTVWSNPPDAPSYIALTPEQGWENG